jgi:hypothetical protein
MNKQQRTIFYPVVVVAAVISALFLFGQYEKSQKKQCKESGGTWVTPVDKPTYCIEGDWDRNLKMKLDYPDG